MGAPTYVAGVDPGVNTGIAVLKRRDKSLVHIATRDFFGTQTYLTTHYPDRSEIKVVVEIPPEFVYARHAGWLEAKTKEERAKILFNIGGNRREAQLLAKAIRRLGYDVREELPVQQTKWDLERFRLAFRTTITANAHERDAARLALVYL